MSEQIVVGFDGSPAALSAVEWAAEEAARKNASLRVVYALDRQPYHIVRFADGRPDGLLSEAEKILEPAAARAREVQPGLRVTTEVVEGTPVRSLLNCAAQAAELVIGSRGLGGFTGSLLGSVSIHVAGHAPCPVVVVRAGSRERRGEIVLGVDDSPECEPAIAYAFEQAALRDATLRAVHAYQLPIHAYAPEVVYDMDEVRAAQHRVTTERLAAYAEKYPQVTVVEDVRCAHPVNALTAAAENADLLVVGSHGRGTFASAVLGSVSHGVLHHTTCPVAVVTSRREK